MQQAVGEVNKGQSVTLKTNIKQPERKANTLRVGEGGKNKQQRGQEGLLTGRAKRKWKERSPGYPGTREDFVNRLRK